MWQILWHLSYPRFITSRKGRNCVIYFFWCFAKSRYRGRNNFSLWGMFHLPKHGSIPINKFDVHRILSQSYCTDLPSKVHRSKYHFEDSCFQMNRCCCKAFKLYVLYISRLQTRSDLFILDHKSLISTSVYHLLDTII